MGLITMTINGARYVAIPVDEYDRLRGAKKDESAGDGVDWLRAEMGATLRRARETAGLSQIELAKKLGKSQALVSRAEVGDLSISEKYVASVIKACGLPKNWPAKETGGERVGRDGGAAKRSRRG
jgi:ribosome-binding protein aMBF1 (putative translation factor)